MRLIDADAFKEYIRNSYEEVKHMYQDGGKLAKQVTEAFCEDIDEQPTIEPQKWTPCSVRMPENDESVLISLKDGRVFEGQWSDDADFPIWSACYGESSAYPKEVLAWMPMPEPWKWEK